MRFNILKDIINRSKIAGSHSGSCGLFNIRPVVFLSVLLICATITVYWPLKNNGFINFDDNLYITDNEIVKRGLTAEGVHWAWRFNDKGYWQPLTWLSHMLDCELFGLNPAGHHFSNLMIHLANVLVLFWFLSRTTKCVYRSAIVAAFFALHPLNVESIAWAAERKNVLSTFFWFLAILIYSYYVRKKDMRVYFGMLACFVLGIMAKPMAVTFPFLLLLLDFWPLGRIKFSFFKPHHGADDAPKTASDGSQSNWSGIILEKVPLLVLSAASILLSIFSLQQMKIMVAGSVISIQLRLSNALVSYISYIKKMFWPHELAIFYPFPKHFFLWEIFGSLALLAGISLLSLSTINRRSYFFVGWFWYVGTLLPVIGLVQTGLWPALADRWAYVPIVGLFILIVWSCSDLCLKFQNFRSSFVTVFFVVLLVFGLQTRGQVHNWADSATIFQHTLQATGENAVAHFSLGDNLVKQGKLAEGIDHYRSALRLKPFFSRVHNDLGVALAYQGDTNQAIVHFEKALKVNPNYADAHNNIGVALREQGQMALAANHFMQAIRIDPMHANAHHNLGCLLMQQGKYEKSTVFFKKALKIKPGFIQALENLKKATAEL